VQEDEEEEKPGDKYEGEVKMGIRDGQGKYTWSNGSFYEGSYVEGKKHGEGKMKYPDGSVYVGDWKDDAMDGYGTYTYTSGDTYMGEFRDGKKHGKGNYLHIASKSQYVGTFKEGNFDVGKWVLMDNTTYDGDSEVLKVSPKAYDGRVKVGEYENFRVTNDYVTYPLHGHSEELPTPPPPEDPAA